jgi:unsaturated rhamnogalacturonyl hydrolase
VKVIESTLASKPSPNDIGGWSYPVALYLHGQYLAYKRTGNKAYFDYIKKWIDRFVDSSGHVSNGFGSLDSMLPGIVALDVYAETKDPRYAKAFGQIHDKLLKGGYPRTKDGGFWHGSSRPHQLWLDGCYMALPGLARYGHLVTDSVNTDNEAANQILIYDSHLRDTTGLRFHAYDESGSQSWAVPPANHSSYFWGRSIGWFAMATIEILEVLPKTHPKRPALIAVVKDLAQAFKKYQDPKSGRWFQVVDKPTTSGNWLETSCSSMYSFMLSRGVQRGYLDSSYASVAAKGRAGVLTQLTLDSHGHTQLANICEGTNVGTLSYYLGRARKTNDFHGLGSFLIMNEQFMKPPA